MKTKKINTSRGSKMLFLSKIKGFTFVELIVVITILAILGTIGFISIQGYSSSARDSTRISNLTNLRKGLDIVHVTGMDYPIPENTVNILASGSIIGYQGFAKDGVWNIAKLSAGTTKDPLDLSMYITYATNLNQSKMQAMAFLENGSSVTVFNEIIDITHANGGSNYSSRFPTTTWDNVGILLASGSLLPIQETGTGLDIMNTNSSYIMQFNNSEKITGTGTVLKTGIGGVWLVGYWDMDAATGTGINDMSGKWNTLIVGNGALSFTGGKIWNAFTTTGSNCLTTNISNVINKNTRQFTISALTFSPTNNLPMNSNEMPFWLYGMNPTTGSGYPYMWWHKSFNATSSWFLLFRGMTSYYEPEMIPNSGYQVMDTYYPPVNDIFDKWHLDTIVISEGNYSYYQDGIRVFSKRIGNYIVPENINMTVWCGVIIWWGLLVYPNSPLANVGNSGWGYKWYGHIDELRLYNRAITDAEILALYNSTK